MIQRFFLLAAFAVSLSAAPFTGMVVFGDSLSDTGRLFAATGGTFPPDPPYFQGRGSNGPLAVEYLSDLLGVPILDNFAFYGATTGLGNIVDGGTPAVSNGLPGVLKTYSDALIGGLSVNPTDLYIILGGPANDFRNGDFSPTALLTAVSNQIALVTMLQAQGAQNIVIAGVPDLGLLPFVAQQGPAVALGASLFSQAYNDALRAALPRAHDSSIFRQFCTRRSRTHPSRTKRILVWWVSSYARILMSTSFGIISIPPRGFMNSRQSVWQQRFRNPACW